MKDWEEDAVLFEKIRHKEKGKEEVSKGKKKVSKRVKILKYRMYDERDSK